ncbi:MAG: dihydrofolate reductase [Alphaproteobacteria bacterium]|nr:dihydrofolate reductase [Alphaproteobacteria bacterium]
MKKIKTILYIAISQDGFIADKDGGVSWLDPYNNIEGEDCGYHAFYESIDGIIMGSRSYEQILGFGEWIWPGKPTFVFTAKSLQVNRPEVVLVHEDVATFMSQSRSKEQHQNLWLLGGAELIKSFAALGLIDECIITIIPTSLGTGIPLSLPYEDFELAQTKQCKESIVQKVYTRK